MSTRIDPAQLDAFADPGGQWMTPEWAAAELVARYFADLSPADLVVEPSCGRGAFLKALPAEVPAVGVELDPVLAAAAREASGREVIVGDFRRLDLVLPPATAIVGNPPFDVRTIEAFLARARHLLPDDGRCGLLLPAYALQTHQRVMRWHATWSLRAEIIPRRLFPRLRLPLVFVLFTKERVRTLVGFALYPEACAVDDMTAAAKLVLAEGRPRMGVWRALVLDTLARCGGRATLPQLYAAIAPRRPTPNPWWQEKVRQELQRNCRSVARGEWELAS